MKLKSVFVMFATKGKKLLMLYESSQQRPASPPCDRVRNVKFPGKDTPSHFLDMWEILQNIYGFYDHTRPFNSPHAKLGLLFWF